MQSYIRDVGLEDEETAEEEDESEAIQDVSPLEMDKLLGGK